MKTITELHRDRLVAEAEEADKTGLTKIAENITRQVEKVSVRPTDTSYTYTINAFEQDVNDSLWDVVTRTSDFHGAFLDSKKAQEIVDYFSAALVTSIRKSAGIHSPIGAYEPAVPGEDGQPIILDVDEE